MSKLSQDLRDKILTGSSSSPDDSQEAHGLSYDKVWVSQLPTLMLNNESL